MIYLEQLSKHKKWLTFQDKIYKVKVEPNILKTASKTYSLDFIWFVYIFVKTLKYLERTINSRQKLARYPTRKHSPKDEYTPNHLPYKLLVFYVCWLTLLVLLNLFEKSYWTFSSNFLIYFTLSSMSPLKSWVAILYT